MRIGLAADHGGFELKESLARELRTLGHEVKDFGAARWVPEDDYPDYVIPLAEAVAHGEVERAIAVCGSGVGAAIVADKVKGVRASVVQDAFSARQGVEDDDLNLICLGGRVLGQGAAAELVSAFLSSRFSGAERHCRRLAKVAALEGQ